MSDQQKKEKNLLWAMGYFGIYLLIQMGAGLLVGIGLLLFGAAQGVGGNFKSVLSENALLISLTANLGVALGFYLILGWRRQKWREVCNFRSIASKTDILLLTLAGVAFNFIMMLFYLMPFFQKHISSYNHSISGLVGEQHLVMVLLTVGLVGPVVEEIVFRGIIFSELQKKVSPGLANLLQALLFGLVHVNLFQSTYTFLLGFVLGGLCLVGRSLWFPIIVHIAFNTFSVVFNQFVAEHNFLTEGFSYQIALAVSLIYVLIAGKYYLKNFPSKN